MQPFSASSDDPFCTKFQEYIYKGFRVIERTHTEIYKEA